MKRTISLATAVLCGIGLATAAGVAPAAADPGPWSVVQLPLPADSASAAEVTLGKGACGAPGQCVIPGSYLTNRNKTEALIETVTNGVAAARALPAPAEAPADPRVNLLKAACPSSGRCVAVGNYQQSGGPLVGELVWQTATGWRAITAPAPAGYEGKQIILYDVTCAGGVCFAVGTVSGKPLVERFANGTWTPTALSSPAGAGGPRLETVSCSSSRHCVAAGAYYVGTVRRRGGAQVGAVWDGTNWTTTSLPQPADAATHDYDSTPAISTCVTGGTCHVLSPYPPSTRPPANRPADFANDANGWTAVALPDGRPVAKAGTHLYDIYCSAPKACVAVGVGFANSTYGTIATLTTAGWSVMYAPGPVGATSGVALTALNCLPDGSCTAFGSYYTGTSSEYIATDLTGAPTSTTLPAPPAASFIDPITTAVYDGTRQLVAATYSDGSTEHAALWTRTV